ncbi:MAG: hypothetical protein Q8K36_01645 [Alphaproteobacteria bacterium]|nr:hypothetical protein [Alphaproteobacteria bacterium]
MKRVAEDLRTTPPLMTGIKKKILINPKIIPSITEKRTPKAYALRLEKYTRTYAPPRYEYVHHTCTFTFKPKAGAISVKNLLRIVEAKEK